MRLGKGFFTALVSNIILSGTTFWAITTIAGTPSVPDSAPREVPKYGGSVKIPTVLPKPEGESPSRSQPTSVRSGRLAYIGPGCDSSEGTEWEINNGKWQEAIGSGYCKRANWLTWPREPSYVSPPNLPGFPSRDGAFIQVTSNFMMQWQFFALAQAGTEVSIAVYIPTEKSAPNLSRLPGIVSRRVRYEGIVYDTAKKKFDVCFEKEVDQEQYKDDWIELGTCKPKESTMVVLHLRDIDPIDKRVNYRMVGDVACEMSIT